jgi:predicted PurR-regulated permease PerM/methylmalonyl-CoA mutase cobalamin-binding subunit
MARTALSSPVAAPVVPAIVTVVIAVAVLYFAQELFVPLAFALLLSFLLGPAVVQLGKWGMPRIPSVIAVMSVATAVIAVGGWFITVELIHTAESLPGYSGNVARKIQALEGKSKSLSRIVSAVEELGNQVDVADTTPAPQKTGATGVAMPVRIVEEHTILQVIRNSAGSLLRPLGTIGLILVFTIFMLIDREGMRNRLLRLMGQGHLQATTKAMDDAGHRVSRYILMQSAVNMGFGAIITLGLFLLGVPGYLLWGLLGMLMRFVPYVGPLIGWLLPFLVAVAESEGWTMPLSVTALFFTTEMIVGNFVEPLLYGVHTGLSAVAILVSAVFWTVLWGPIGLVLATPMTVCLSVLGRYTPQLAFLNVVLGDEPALAPDVVFYQRLLALDQQDAMNMLENLGKGKPLITVFDEIVIPALAMAERDRQTGQLDTRREEFIVQSIHEFVTELTEADTTPLASRPARATRIFCLPAASAADEIAAAMCAHFLTQEGFPTISFPVTESPGQLIKALGAQSDDVVCISAVPPFSGGHARKVAKDVRENGVESVIIAGLWGYSASVEGGSSARLGRLQKSLSATVVASLEEAVAQAKLVESQATAALLPESL